jgi:hypothetical protein
LEGAEREKNSLAGRYHSDLGARLLARSLYSKADSDELSAQKNENALARSLSLLYK